VNDPKNRTLANLEDRVQPLSNPKNCYQIHKIAGALAMLFVENETVFGCRFANPKYGDHHAELLMASRTSRCRIFSSKRGIP
jgi:hypothetical protein